MNLDFLGDVTDTDHEVRAAGRQACIDLGLPISDAAFDLIDKAAEYVVETLGEYDTFSEGEDVVCSQIGDWMSACGIVSPYTAVQVQQWADLGAWQADVSEEYPYAGEGTVSDRIGAELSIIATTVGQFMLSAVSELQDEVDA